jgi:uncharacterized protein
MPTIETARSWYLASDPVHGFDHVLRVYHLAERLAQIEGADIEIVRAAVLLHDAEGGEWKGERGEWSIFARKDRSSTEGKESASQRFSEVANEQISSQQSAIINSRLTHHHASADFAAQVLREEGWPDERIAAVKHCIRAHRYRDRQEPPQTLEAKVLFDADKLDAIGAVGVARAIGYAIQAGQPAYAPPSAQFLAMGELEPGEPHSAYHEYLFKLRRIKDRMLTATGRKMAVERHQVMAEFFERLAREMGGE